MLDTVTAASAPVHGRVRSLVDRDEYGPLTGHASGLFTVPVVPVVLAERDELAPAPRLRARRRPALTLRDPPSAARAWAAPRLGRPGPRVPSSCPPAGGPNQ